MTELIHSWLVPAAYLVSAVLFIVGIKQMGRVRTARRGNQISALGMLLAVVGTLLELGVIDYRWIVGGAAIGALGGVVSAMRVPMTQMPEFVALYNGSGGAASVLVALSYYWLRVVEAGRGGETAAAVLGVAESGTMALSIVIGGVTFSGSVVAFLQLQGSLLQGKPILLPARHLVNLVATLATFGLGGYLAYAATGELGVSLAIAVTAMSLVLGVLLVIPIGGADMPVVISLLNSYSGMAACATGFVLANNVLIITGAIVGASGIILTQVMCDAMNRSFVNVLLGGFGTEDAAAAPTEYQNVRSCGAEEAALVLENAESVVFAPGYGLAVSQAQHACRELAQSLEKRGVRVSYAIHPVAGRMPGHMNVLLAEADVPYEQLVEMEQINPELKNTDVVIVLGANDVVNPAALDDPKSPIAGMPILEVHRARSVFVVKRSLGAGYAGIKNELFERPNTMMIFGDAKKVLQSLAEELRRL